jgi:hypothetical protein
VSVKSKQPQNHRKIEDEDEDDEDDRNNKDAFNS